MTSRAVSHFSQEKFLTFQEGKAPPGFPSTEIKKSLLKNKDKYQQMGQKQQQHSATV